MPGIVGIVDSQEDSSSAQQIRSMMQPLLRQVWPTAHTAVTPRAEFGSVQIDEETRLVKQCGVMLLWVCEIVRRAAHLMRRERHLCDRGVG